MPSSSRLGGGTASNGGADRPPGWIHNVAANNSVEVQVARRKFESHAEVIGADHADHARLWTLVNEKTRGRYHRYQQQTTRRFDLLKLHRDDR
jgi:F420H(2)-dependent quinone reductase